MKNYRSIVKFLASKHKVCEELGLAFCAGVFGWLVDVSQFPHEVCGEIGADPDTNSGKIKAIDHEASRILNDATKSLKKIMSADTKGWDTDDLFKALDFQNQRAVAARAVINFLYSE